MKNARVLILTSAHLCRNPRVLKEASTLGTAGYDVTVLSISTQQRFEQMDVELARELPFRRATVDATASTTRQRRLATFVQRSATWSARWLCRGFRMQSVHALGPAHALLAGARAHAADLTIVHNELAIWAAGALVREGRRVAVDMEDWHSEDLLEADRRGRPVELLRRAESFALNACAYSSVPSMSMGAALVAACRCPPPIVLRNSFALQSRSRTHRSAPEEPPAFIWFSQTIGPGRGLEPFFLAWAQTKNPSCVHLLGEERAGYRNRLLTLIPPARRALVHFHRLVTPGELPLKLTEFDLGLALEQHKPLSRDLTITNKLLQYLNAGLAVIATDTAGQREILRAAPSCGILVQSNDTPRFAQQLDDLLGNRTRLRACQQAARAAAVTEFSWEHEAPRLLAAVERATTATALRQ